VIAAGSRLGPYEVLAPLGAGGMGEVYRARDPRLAREVAIKVLPSELAADRERLKRFEREARSASSLNHPAIVTIYEIGQADSVSYIAMELVDGKTLREVLDAGALPMRRLLSLGAQVADGLAKAHAAGIVHRDLKPENVMVTGDGFAKILDFGLAKLTQSEPESGEHTNAATVSAGTEPGVVMGTVGYMSPEQAVGHTLDFRSDQFSFGSVLYEMTTGKRAFSGRSKPETLAAIIREEPESIASLNPKVPPPLRWIIERCLAKEVKERYASTEDLARDLASVRDHLSEASFSGAVLAAPQPPGILRVRTTVLMLSALLILAAGFFAGRPVWQARSSVNPTIRQITYRRAGVANARFAPDGQIVYSAATSEGTAGEPGELFSTRPGAVEPRSLGLPLANILSISSSGELAIISGGSLRQGTLATVSLAGGAPRELLENVRRAVWSPDGKGLAVVHVVKGKNRIEFPIGKVLYEVALPAFIGEIGFSPKGDRIAFFDSGSSVPGGTATYGVLDLAGNKRTITGAPFGEFQWSPRGDEIWFAHVEGGTTAVEAVTLSGRKRPLASFPGDFAFHDVDRDGRLLLERIMYESEIVGRSGGDPIERNLSWLDGSVLAALSDDGKTLLFSENGPGGGPKGAVYKRRMDGSPAVRLGEGWALDLSPDGQWALTRTRGPDGVRLTLLPTGAGQPRAVPLSGIQPPAFGSGASFFPDGKRLLVRGAEKGRPLRLFAVDLETGKARAFTPEGVPFQTVLSISPDGKRVASTGDEEVVLYDVEGGSARPIPGLSKGLTAIKWCADGRSLFVRTAGTHPLRVSRLDISSGRLEPWKEFSLSDVGAGIVDVIPTPDGNSYAYGYGRYFSDLFIAEGIK
jgi:Tol biopolymer transport system component